MNEQEQKAYVERHGKIKAQVGRRFAVVKPGTTRVLAAFDRRDEAQKLVDGMWAVNGQRWEVFDTEPNERGSLGKDSFFKEEIRGDIMKGEC